jgi:hypothetical protein
MIAVEILLRSAAPCRDEPFALRAAGDILSSLADFGFGQALKVFLDVSSHNQGSGASFARGDRASLEQPVNGGP